MNEENRRQALHTMGNTIGALSDLMARFAVAEPQYQETIIDVFQGKLREAENVLRDCLNKEMD